MTALGPKITQPRLTRARDARLAQLEAELAAVRARLAVSEEQLASARARIDAAEASVSQLAAGVGRNDRGVTRATLMDSIASTTAWVAALPPSEMLISVILPTRNRAAALPGAIASVQAQTHAAWELVVVDDGSDDDTSSVLAGVSDPRVRIISRRSDPSPAASRNAGLAAARGAVIAYLDDDNIMQAHWLRAVAWQFDREPDADVAYGALLLEDHVSGRPVYMLEPWSRARLAIRNLVDQNAIAHRAGLPEAVFDEQLDASEDWDLMLRLTADRSPACVPVVAALYLANAPDRMSQRIGAPVARLELRTRALRRRRLRLVGVGALGELVDGDLAAAAGVGAQVAWCGPHGGPPPAGDLLFGSLGDTVEEFQPDLLYLHVEQLAVLPLREIESLSLPFAIRTGTSPDARALAVRLRGHPWCAYVRSSEVDAGHSPESFLEELIGGLQELHLKLVGPLPGPPLPDLREAPR